ncbi:MAG TPA: glycoside hydrolase [Bacteroidetes bacterium]|nr:glycoside hydrolase [Bacteroidota bacterium]HRR09649.1 NlpC/P60 family protein [Rhodothermales bacterium]
MLMQIRIPQYIGLCWIGVVFITTGCNSTTSIVKPTAPVPTALVDAAQEVQNTFAPDSRVAHFQAYFQPNGTRWVLKGETNLPAAKSALLQNIAQLGIAMIDSLQLLPNITVGEKTWAMANNAVINLRYKPEHAAEMATQVLLGQLVQVLKAENYWYWVQTPDGYLAWVEGGALHRLTESGKKQYEAAPKIVYLRPFGFSFSQPDERSEPVSDLTAGNILIVTGEEGMFFRVNYPDGRMGFVSKTDVMAYDLWQTQTRATSVSLVETARRLMGVPYLWGGTSAKGVDCSGFTKTIYAINGLMLQRDASQQAREGILVDETGNFAKLQPGDLLFFGKKATPNSRERVIHVGMWIGEGRFIHSSSRVQINSMVPEQPDYSAYEHGRYLYSRRMLGHVPGVRLSVPAMSQ